MAGIGSVSDRHVFDLAAAQTDGPGTSMFPPGPSSLTSDLQRVSELGLVAPGRLRPVPELNRNIDIGAEAYNAWSPYEKPIELMKRPAKGNTSGVAVVLRINAFKIVDFPTKTIWQYDVIVGNGAEKRGLIMAIWTSKTVQAAIKGPWIFDGNRLAWSLEERKEFQLTVDLDEERGRLRREGRSNSHKVRIRPTKKINLAAIDEYIKGKIGYENSVMESISFLDHLLREQPSKRMIAIKRSLFPAAPTNAEKMAVGNGVEAWKGIYQSIRAAEKRLIVQVDVANSTFWGSGNLALIARNLTGWSDVNEVGFRATEKIQKGSTEAFRDSVEIIKLRKLKKAQFTVTHSGQNGQGDKVFTIKEIGDRNAYNYKFDLHNRQTGEIRKNTSVFEYFKIRYNITLTWPTLPVIETTKRGVVFPMEVCVLKPGQRYNFKLDEAQTAKMIKFAVSRPQDRRKGIENGVNALNWSEDTMLRAYGLSMDTKFLETKAKLLTAPTIEFGDKKIERPGTTGRWRLDGKKFFRRPRSQTGGGFDLERWGVCVMNDVGHGNNIGYSQVVEFTQAFIAGYKAHGGTVDPRLPPIINFAGRDTPGAVTSLIDKTRTLYGKDTNPQILVFMVNSRDTQNYLRLKKNCECRFGIVSQVMQSAHIPKKSPQYISNVLMKVNAKLGGTTARVVPTVKMPAGSWNGYFKVPTMIIGADVSHASPGSLQPSTASLTVSMDRDCIRYSAGCQTNGHRVEIISHWNMVNILSPLFTEWMMSVGEGKAPQHVIYMRDGVSEGQYQHVMQHEVNGLRQVWQTVCKDHPELLGTLKFTVGVVTKRHRIRFFPTGPPCMDKNGNPCPGTLVEHDVTHPHENDFYLCSHSAIQGTARPVHWQILMDEMNMPPTQLQNMLYEHCYQYMRSTTPVSVHPAVYYAHLASNRAKAHEDISATTPRHTSEEERRRQHLLGIAEARMISEWQNDGQTAESFRKMQEEVVGRSDYKPLLKLWEGFSCRIKWDMWYI